MSTTWRRPRLPHGRVGRSSRGGPGATRTILAHYLAEIRRYPWLTRHEEAGLAREAQAGGSEALDRLVECNLQFVVRVARDYRHRGLPLEDLISEGNLGLIEAARRFDPNQGTRFITWAVWWIRKSILLALAEQVQVVRLPLSQVKRMHIVQTTEKTLAKQLEREPTREEITASLPAGWTDLESIHRHGIRFASLDEPLHPDRAETFADSLVDRRRGSAEEQLLAREETDNVNALYDELNDQQKTVIAWRFGLGGRDELTLQEIGRQIGCSREGVRQVEAKAIQRLQQWFRRRRKDRRLRERRPGPVSVASHFT